MTDQPDFDRQTEFVQLLNGAHRRLLAYLVTLLGNLQDAEDVLQTAIVLNESNLMTLMKQAIVNEIFPVGAIYTSDSNVNPGDNWTWQTWVPEAQARVIVGVGLNTDDNNFTADVVDGATGGTYNHTLILDEMPAHSHEVSGRFVGDNSSGGQANRGYGASEPGASWSTKSTGGKGGVTEPFDIIQPYIGRHYWRRTA